MGEKRPVIINGVTREAWGKWAHSTKVCAEERAASQETDDKSQAYDFTLGYIVNVFSVSLGRWINPK